MGAAGFSYAYYRTMRIIATKGTSVLIARKTQTYDPVQGLASSIVWTTTAVLGLVMSTDEEFVVPKEADTLTDMITVLLAAKDIPIVPSMLTDDLIFNGTIYRIVNIMAGYVRTYLATYELRCQL